MDLERIRILARWYLLQEGLMGKKGKWQNNHNIQHKLVT
jgi:hypothetical protein